jgi:hypothetical protein
VIDKLKGKYQFIFDLKEKQKCLITNIMERKNSIGIFPTGYGKSVCFQMVSLIMSIIIFKNVQWKVTYRKRNLKKTFIYSDYLLKNICQEDPNSHFSLYKRNEIYMFDRSRTRFHDKNWQKSGARFFLRSFESF